MLLALTALLSAAALVVRVLALTKLEHNPTYTATQIAATKAQLFSMYALASEAVTIETNGNDSAFARIAAANGAIILEHAAIDPALDNKYRDAALNLAQAYQTMTAAASRGSDNKQFQGLTETMTAGQRALKELCGD